MVKMTKATLMGTSHTDVQTGGAIQLSAQNCGGGVLRELGVLGFFGGGPHSIACRISVL